MQIPGGLCGKKNWNICDKNAAKSETYILL
jgi:hypothetical protein